MKHLLLSSALFVAILCVTPAKAMDYIDDQGVVYKPYKKMASDFVPSLKKEECINLKMDGDVVTFDVKGIYKINHEYESRIDEYALINGKIKIRNSVVKIMNNEIEVGWLDTDSHYFINLQEISFSERFNWIKDVKGLSSFEKLKLLVLKKLN